MLSPVPSATLVMARCGLGVPGVVTSAHCCAAPPVPSSTQETGRAPRRERAAWVVVGLAVEVIVPTGGRCGTGFDGVQLSSLTFGSVTVTLWSVTSPWLVATIV